MRKILFILMAVVLTACASVGAASSEFDQAQDKWQEADISHYSFELTYSCFCAFTSDMPLIIEVQDGEIVSMEYKNGNEIDPASYELFEKYATINRIFAELEMALNGGADSVTVTYDETYGYPTQVNIDFDQQVADEEIYLTISNLEVLP
ncbi:MAG TPA: DUF6174 domain-containing protein [Anaerolineales bacterium]|nr:DUF6174 domain-containing protein [Anaerolineales bacterium]